MSPARGRAAVRVKVKLKDLLPFHTRGTKMVLQKVGSTSDFITRPRLVSLSALGLLSEESLFFTYIIHLYSKNRLHCLPVYL